EATDRVPLAAPAAVGAHLTLTVQVPPAAMEVPQVLAWLNAPVTDTPETVAAVLLGLVTVTVCAALVEPAGSLPKATLVGDAVSAVAVLVPVPDSATVSGLPGSLEATDRVPLAAPAAVGANLTLTVQG